MELNFERDLWKNLKIGMIFPGQGSQYLGMGKEFYDNERIFQEMFEDASHALKENFVQICFASSDKILQGTIITQTAIFLVSAATYTLLVNEYGVVPNLIAGHSLGEYSAVFAGGGIDFYDALYLLNKRASIMEKAMKDQQGGLLAVMNIDQSLLHSICDRYDQSDSLNAVAEIAIFNSSTQVVLSGTEKELDMIAEEVAIMKGKAIKLPVAGAFHSRLLSEAEKEYAPFLLKADFHDLKIPIINNIMAQKITTPEQIKLSLVKQTSSHIYWWNSMQQFKDMDVIIEVGPNDKFSKMLRRDWPEKPIISINSYEDINNMIDILSKLSKR